MDAEISPPQVVARVKRLSEDRSTAFLELRNGSILTCTTSGTWNLERGDITFVDTEAGSVEFAPEDLWDEEPWVGVVRLLSCGQVVVDVGGRLKVLDETAEIDLREGNTVTGYESRGITQVISEDPVRYIDLPTVDSVTVEQFKASPDRSLSFEDFGGHAEIKERARELIEVPLEHHDALTRIGARPIKGVLFTGPPGTGKTMLAKIIAHRADAEFYEVSGPEVLSKWYGQSEELIRAIFQDAAAQERAIVFFDEIDSLASQRTKDSHEASRRVVGQLLAAMDGFTADTNVVVIATTNRPQDLDGALRRPGRFDWEINFPPPNLEDRLAILEASARKLNRAEDLPHSYIAEKTANWTPAELAAIWSEAALLAVMESRDAIFEDDYVSGYERVAQYRKRHANRFPERMSSDS
ncbi:ATP-binding protein [Streptomyces cyaneofuscatus]|uniref:ATP-binding protein n=1 Tax=Streptomyces cyaneofuscatus TaxID=66883 RepID=UPI0029553605|nr:ATP-binding protein [Streptomyces cyaneofuscatus]WOP12019.1 ATP-binding protein [Streptomyces cyaneofuscatus]